MKIGLVLALLAMIACGVALLIYRPWIEDVRNMPADEFRRRMNELIGQHNGTIVPDGADRLSGLLSRHRSLLDDHIKALGTTAFEDQLVLLIDEARLGPYPNPRLEPFDRFLAELESSGLFRDLDALRSEGNAVRMWNGLSSPHEEFGKQVESFGPARALMRTILGRMRLQAARGDREGALSSFSQILWIGRSQAAGLLLVSRLTGSAATQSAFGELRYEIVEGLHDASGLTKCRDILEREAVMPPLAATFEAESLWSLATLEESLELEGLSTRSNRRRARDEIQRILDEARSMNVTTTPGAAGLESLVEHALSERHTMDETLQAARASWATSIKVARFWEAEKAGTLALVAIERHRLEKGSLPQSLDELVPAYLPSVPIDPFDGKPLRYVVRPSGGFRLYSIGPDQADNDGVTSGQGAGWDTPGNDIPYNEPRPPMRKSSP